MSLIYNVEGKNIRLEENSINFEHNIQDVKYWDGIYVVLLKIPNNVNEKDNVYGIDASGKLMWKIQNPVEAFDLKGNEQGYNYLASSVYVQIHVDSSGIFTATTFFGIKYTFDYKTGKLLKQESVRW